LYISYNEWLSTSFEWLPEVETINPNSSRIKATKLFNIGLQVIHHSWDASNARIISAHDIVE
jgi:hypothetical protein